MNREGGEETDGEGGELWTEKEGEMGTEREGNKWTGTGLGQGQVVTMSWRRCNRMSACPRAHACVPAYCHAARERIVCKCMSACPRAHTCAHSSQPKRRRCGVTGPCG